MVVVSEEILQVLYMLNYEYFNKYGFIFIICVIGFSVDIMLEVLQKCLFNDMVSEFENVVVE